jgi:hypothetical protein
MKYIKLFENFNKSEIVEICKKYSIENYTINPDGSIDVNGDVNLRNVGLTKLPLKFNRISGSFTCSSNNLISLDGCPKEVGGGFYCNNNYLTRLDGCPKEVGNSFDCGDNNLTTLEGCPKEVGGNFKCIGNKSLTTLEGGPEYVGSSFMAIGCSLTTLKGVAKRIKKSLHLRDNNIFRFIDFPQECDNIVLDGNPIQELISLFKDIKILREAEEMYNFIRPNKTIIKSIFMEACEEFNIKPKMYLSEYKYI